jgi:hypothetical protein|nr:Spi family protease inhibitor [uncultured Flavobacterium sp.]
MKQLYQNVRLIGIATSIIFSLIFLSCESSEEKNTNKTVSFSKDVMTNSLKNDNGLITEELALDIATKFNPVIFFNQNNPTNYSKKVSSLNGNNKIKNKFVINDSNKIPAFYVFNFENNQGFIFVSADYKMQPILAFIENGEFKKDNVPSGLLQWVDTTIEDIEILRKGKYDNSKLASYAWNNYYFQNLNNTSNINLSRKPVLPLPNPCDTESSNTSTTVGPLLNVTWGQVSHIMSYVPIYPVIA